MDSVWFNIATFLTIFSFAIISPGPNFILVVNTALADSRKAGLFSAFGVAVGSGLFGFAGLVGLIVIVNSLPHFATVIRMAGGGYLLWLGINMVRKSPGPLPSSDRAVAAVDGITPMQAWRIGLLTNLTNPKAWAFYFALFTVVLTPGFLFWHKALLNGSMFLISFGWYALVALLVSSNRFRPGFEKYQPAMQAVLGLLLMGLGGRMFIV